MHTATLGTIAKRWKQAKSNTDEWTDKQDVTYSHKRILFGLKGKGNSNTCYNMDELEGIMLNVMISLIQGSWSSKIRDTENRKVARDWGVMGMESFFWIALCQVDIMKRVPEKDSGDNCITMWT